MEDSVVQHSPLLRLPCELRLRIYDELVPIIPLKSDSRPTQFTGLLCSCKAIQYELEPEISKRMATAIAEIADLIHQSTGMEMVYTPPGSFCGWRNLTICWHTLNTYMLYPRCNPLLEFREFWFDTLTIHLHNDPNTYELFRTHPYIHATTELADVMASYAETTGSLPRPKRWVLLFGGQIRPFVLHKGAGMNMNNICCDGEFRWIWRPNSSIRGSGVVFCKIPQSIRPNMDPTQKDMREIFRDVRGRSVSEMGCEMDEGYS